MDRFVFARVLILEIRMVSSENGGDYMAFPDDPEDKDTHVTVEKLPVWKLISIAVSFGIAQFAWSVQIGWVTPTLKTLGLPNKFVAYAYLAGPISGILVQVLVGAWSDRCTSRFGRRRPFMMAGALIAAVSFIGFSNAKELGELLGDSASHRPWGIFFGILFFWTLDFSINALQGPVRTLLADVAPPSQHRLGNTFFGVTTGLGNAVGYFLGSISNIRNHLGLGFMGTDLRVLYTIAALAIIVVTGYTCLVIKEKRYVGGTSFKVSGGDILATFKGIQLALYPVFVVQFCTWFACFTYFIYGTSWVGTNVYHGSADEQSPLHQQFQDGVYKGNMAMGFQSIVSFVYALILPLIMKVIGVKAAYGFSQLVQGAMLLLTIWWQTKTGAFVIFPMLGITYGSTQVIPWLLVTLSVSKSEKKGFYLAFMNLFQCFPEILVSLLALPWLALFKDDNTSILALGGVVALVGLIVVFFIPTAAIYAAADLPEPRGVVRKLLCGTRKDGDVNASQTKYQTFGTDEVSTADSP